MLNIIRCGTFCLPASYKINIKNKVYRTVICLLLFVGVKLVLILREEHRRGVFEKRVLRKISGPKRDEVIGERRRNIILVIESRRISYVAGHVARRVFVRQEIAYRVLVGKRERKRPFARLSVEGRILLKWILKKWDGEAGTGLIWLSTGTRDGLLWMR